VESSLSIVTATPSEKELTKICDAALRANPSQPLLLRLRGALARRDQEYEFAIACFARAADLEPSNASIRDELERTRRQASVDRKVGFTIGEFKRVLAQQQQIMRRISVPDLTKRMTALAHATAMLQGAASAGPTEPGTCQLAVVAAELSQQGVDHRAAAWCALGRALRLRTHFEEAAEAYQEALNLRPTCLKALLGLGVIGLELARPKESIRHLEAALATEPTHPAAHQLLGWAYALTGDLERNWEEIAWFDAHGPWNRFEQPRWDGSSLEHKTILLWINAGLGDTIQHLRFVPLLKPHGARIIVECDPSLLSLVQRMPEVDTVIGQGSPLPHFDFHALFASLPRMFRINLNNLPATVPYLSIDPEAVARRRRQLAVDDRKTVGLVWGSRRVGWDSRLKSAPLAAFSPLAAIPGVRFISLQLGAQAAELCAPPAGMHIECLLSDTVSIADTGALLMNLDLVITIDTMVAHLAGALGRPVWTLLRYGADWRWLCERDTSPWYPTMRLFRQAHRGDWLELLDRVRNALADWMSADASRSAPSRRP
jgi:tetratricopeptide (TPR) repeat protein